MGMINTAIKFDSSGEKKEKKGNGNSGKQQWTGKDRTRGDSVNEGLRARVNE